MSKKFQPISLKEFKFIERAYLTGDPEAAFIEVFGDFDQTELIRLLCGHAGGFIRVLMTGLKGLEGQTELERLKSGSLPALMESCLKSTLIVQSDYERNGNKTLKKTLIGLFEYLNQMYWQCAILPSLRDNALKIDR